jgi:hypothetical protein
MKIRISARDNSRPPGYWSDLAKKVEEKAKFDKPFDMTGDESDVVKKHLLEVLDKDELIKLTGNDNPDLTRQEAFPGAEAFLKAHNLLPTQDNLVTVSLFAEQILEEKYGVMPAWKKFEEGDK